MRDIREEIFFSKFTDLADWIYDEVKGMDGLNSKTADQVSRAIDSVGANLVEGWARGTDESIRAVLQFYRYSLGSAFESLYWLDRLINRNLIKKTKGVAMYKELESACNELKKFMDAMIASEKRSKK